MKEGQERKMYDQIFKILPNKTNRRSICFYLISNFREGDMGNIDEDLCGPFFFLRKPDPTRRAYCVPSSVPIPKYTLGRKYLWDKRNPNPRPFPVLYILLLKEVYE